MSSFQPMVKMETTEPSVILKLKKGGSVKKADGGMMGSPMSAAAAMPPAMPARGGMMGAAAPMKPSLAMRRRAMRGMPSGAGPAGPVGGAATMPAPGGMPGMKKGGKSDTAQDKAMIKKAFKQHDTQEHKGSKGTSLKLKHGGKMATGGVTDGQGGFKKGGKVKMATGGVTDGQGGFATGGVANAQGGFKKGGKIRKMADGGGLLEELGGASQSTPGIGSAFQSGDASSGLQNVNQGASAIGSALRNISSSVGSGGANPQYSMKRGGKASKKAYAAGGTVNSGRPVAMPQGAKKPSQPVKTNLVAGTFKKGGKVTPAEGSLMKASAKENASAMKSAKAQSNDVYSKFQKMKEGGDTEDMSKGGYDASRRNSRELEDALNPLSMMKELAGKAKKVCHGVTSGEKARRSRLLKTSGGFGPRF
jgi:hypothetical protein